MTTNTGWDIVSDDNNSGDFDERKKVDYLPVPHGDTKIRILDETPFAYEEYWSKKGNGGKGTSIPYIGKDCLLDKENQEYLDRELPKAKAIKDQEKKKAAVKAVYANQPWKRRAKFSLNVIDRNDGKVKVLDKGLAVFRELKKYAQNPEYGDLRQYDVTLTRKGDGLATEYSVIPARTNSPLTAEELALEKFDIAESRNYDHVTPEQLLRIAKGETWEAVLGSNDNDTDQEVKTEETPTQADVAEKEEEEKKELAPDDKKNEEFLKDSEEAKTEEKPEELDEAELDGLEFH